MKKSPVLPNESQRLESLLELNILDTMPEPEYDDLVLLASEICKTPIALFSLVDQDRQWFKAKIGMDITETTRDISFCTHAICETSFMEIGDATQDARFADNPFVTVAQGIKFYAGAQVVLPDGSCVGTLCVVDTVPRTLSAKQKDMMQALSRMVSANLIQRKNNEQLKKRDLQLRNALDEIQRVNKQNEAILETMDQGLILQNASGEIIACNRAAGEILDVPIEELKADRNIKSRFNAINENGVPVPPEKRPSSESLATGKSLRHVIMGVTRLDGENRWLSVNATPVLGADSGKPEYVLTTFSDITEIRKKDANLFQSAKMSALGVMAGGIAHEINTPLATIKGKAELLQARIEMSKIDPVVFNEELGKISLTIDRIATIVMAMRKISRDSNRDGFSSYSLRDIVNDTVALCRDRLRKDEVDLRLNIADVQLDCKTGEICQVLVNLIGNSLDAIEGFPEKWIEVSAVSNGTHISISVTDCGNGISAPVAEHMLEPFFTTKEPGKGTGLGLSVSNAIAKSHGGVLFVDRASKHTKMVFELPQFQSILDRKSA